MMNSVNLTGRLTKDIEIRYTQSGVATANFSIAVQSNYKNEDGSYKSDFISIVAFKSQAEFLSKYCLKGDLIGISGRLQTRQWQDSNGRTNYITEVVADSVECYTKHEKPQQQQNQKSGMRVNGKNQPVAEDGFDPNNPPF